MPAPLIHLRRQNLPSSLTQRDASAEARRPTVPRTAAFSVAAGDVAQEGWNHRIYGKVRWRTLISGDRTPSRGLVVGIAEMEADGWLGLHRHEPAEFYLGIAGSGIATIDGVDHTITATTAVYIPGNAEHGLVAGPSGLTFTYGFGVDAFDAISYLFKYEPVAAEEVQWPGTA